MVDMLTLIVLAIGKMAVDTVNTIEPPRCQGRRENTREYEFVVTFRVGKMNKLQEDMHKVPKAGIPIYGSDGENTPPPVY